MKLYYGDYTLNVWNHILYVKLTKSNVSLVKRSSYVLHGEYSTLSSVNNREDAD